MSSTQACNFKLLGGHDNSAAILNVRQVYSDDIPLYHGGQVFQHNEVLILVHSIDEILDVSALHLRRCLYLCPKGIHIYNISLLSVRICDELTQQAPDEFMGIERVHELYPGTICEVLAYLRVFIGLPDDGCCSKIASCPPHRDDLEVIIV